MTPISRAGRPRSLSPDDFGTVFRLRSKGWGFRRIANVLIAQGVVTSKSSVERLVKRLPPYATPTRRPHICRP